MKKIRLLYRGKDNLEFRMTSNPITRTYASPKPTGKAVSEAKNDLEREAIRRHPSYSISEVITLKPGINEFTNAEQAEYLFNQLGQSDEGGSVDVGGGRYVNVQNKQILEEVNEEGEVIKDNLWVKYRRPISLNYKQE